MEAVYKSSVEAVAQTSFGPLWPGDAGDEGNNTGLFKHNCFSLRLPNTQTLCHFRGKNQGGCWDRKSSHIVIHTTLSNHQRLNNKPVKGSSFSRQLLQLDPSQMSTLSLR